MDLLTVTVTLFLLLDPVGNIPVFHALLESWALCAAVLIASPVLLSLLHPRGIRALVRLMGMILVMLGVQMLLDGIAAYLKL